MGCQQENTIKYIVPLLLFFLAPSLSRTYVLHWLQSFCHCLELQQCNTECTQVLLIVVVAVFNSVYLCIYLNSSVAIKLQVFRLLSLQWIVEWSNHSIIMEWEHNGMVTICLWLLCKLVCNLHKFAIYIAWRNWWLEKKNHNLAPELVVLNSNVEFQLCEPPIWPRFFVSNHRRYGQGRTTMLRPLRTCVLRLDLCDGMLSGQLACAWGYESHPDLPQLPLSSGCIVSERVHVNIILSHTV